MEIKKDSSGALAFKGPLTVAHIESAHSQLEPLLDECIRETVLDLSMVDDIDISGLQLLYAIKKNIESEGVFRINTISPQVKEYVLLSGFEAILKEAT
ncbi:MAG: STAS domain-containing protein [Deltaproteobacteria bacterium]|nr:STAS domain-containing protein [Deltaproteobacteria bacterium]